MRKWLGLLGVLSACLVGALLPAEAQVVRPVATPRSAATSRPTATPRIPPEVAGGFPAGAVLWLVSDTQVYSDAAGTTAVTTDAQRVRSWRDQSVNALLFAENNAAQDNPTYETGETNGEPALKFTAGGSSNSLDVTTAVPGLLSLDLTATIAFVAGKSGANTPLFSQDEGSGATDKWIIDNGWASGNGIGIHINTVGGGCAANLASGTSLSTTGYEVWLFRRKSDGTWVWRRNGAQAASGTNACVFPGPNTGELQVGAAENTYGIFSVVEIILYDDALSDTDMGTVETTLNTRCGCY